MKKKRLAGLFLLAPLCLLAACGGGGPSTIALDANWYATQRESIDGTYEKLEYKVSFTPPASKGEYYVTYEEDSGTYTTELSSYRYTFGEGETDGEKTSANVYCYKTELRIRGYYTYREKQGEPFEDSITSTVYFHRTGTSNLRPIESTKEIHSTNPVMSPSEDHMSELIHLTYSVKYSTAAGEKAELNHASITRVNLETGKEQKSEMDIDYDGSYFDNEEILFALRAMKMDEAVTFGTNRTNHTQQDGVMDVIFASVPSEESFAANFDIVGGAHVEEAIKAYKVQFLYDATNSGTPRTAYYAAKLSPENLYRNVLLRLDDPIADNYGTLHYTLVKAQFTP